MTTPKQEKQMREIADLIDESLPLIYGKKMGFFLATSPMSDDPDIADYISNVNRKDAIKWLRETAARLENEGDNKSNGSQRAN